MLNGEDSVNGIKINRSKYQKKKTKEICRCSTLCGAFLCRCFVLLIAFRNSMTLFLFCFVFITLPLR